MLFAGVDPGSESYAITFVDELGRIVSYYEIPTDLVVHDSIRLVKLIRDKKPKIIALPSGHGLPFIKASKIGDYETFLLTLADPQKDGPLRSFLRSIKIEDNAFTTPSVIELESVPEYRKINKIDMGTADKVASAFFYRTLFDSFVLIEMGRHFSSIIVVENGKIIDGFGGTEIPGLISPGCIDGEVAYLLCKYSKITKDVIYSGGEEKRSIEILRIIAEWYSEKLSVPIIVSGKAKDKVNFGVKIDIKYKEASVGSAFIANAIGGGIFRKYSNMLNSSGTPLDYIRLKGWEEITSLIKT
ncbi:DUF1464 family protein [Acidianus sp. HS-5]|uniref:DUF1464 family protein n=1 Tax=Acidianus sp. HS-5 TaxID=2886040 RepID=UPI001F44147D|nr:DUF1464 family protein [Acidianus sp. HS-5]BDC19128.1 acetate kinase [Acidianus sp. HS-5]